MIYGPAYLASSATNIMQGGGGSSAVYDNVAGFVVTNEDTAQQTFSVWKGLTGASTGGTSLFKDYPIGAKQTLSFPFPGKGVKLTSTDYLVGLASAASKVAITVIYCRNAT